MIQGILQGMTSQRASIPYMLLKYYNRLPLTEQEVMITIHLLAYHELEHNEFPTIQELESRMSINDKSIASGLQQLVKKGWIAIEESKDQETGIQSETYNCLPLLQQIIELSLEDGAEVQAMSPPSESDTGQDAAESSGSGKNQKKVRSVSEQDIFEIFEQEFARPLSPMELESISQWLDQDRYKLEVILEALKEAVFAGKVNFRYIDRILLEWSRNRVASAEEARTFTQKFRGRS